VLSSEAFIFECEDEKHRKVLTVHVYFSVSYAWSRPNKSSVTENWCHIMGTFFRWKECTWSFPLQRLRIKMPLTFRCISWYNETWVPQIYSYFVSLYQHSIVGTATRYGLDCPGIESRCGQDFPHRSRTAMGPTQRPVLWVPALFNGGKGDRCVHSHKAQRLKKEYTYTSDPS
jgi:hypothetical protein